LSYQLFKLDGLNGLKQEKVFTYMPDSKGENSKKSYLENQVCQFKTRKQ